MAHHLIPSFPNTPQIKTMHNTDDPTNPPTTHFNPNSSSCPSASSWLWESESGSAEEAE